MKKHLFLLFAITFISTVFSQKIKIKDDIAYVDGEAYVKYKSEILGSEMTISALNSDVQDIFITFHEYTDATKITTENNDGSVKWAELNFLTLNLKCEVHPRFNKGFIKLLLSNDIYVGGVLNVANVKRLISKYGTKYSDNRPEGAVRIIIQTK